MIHAIGSIQIVVAMKLLMMKGWFDAKNGLLGCFVELEYKCRLHDIYYSPKTIQEFSAMLSVLSSLPDVSRPFTKQLLAIVQEKC